MHNHVCLVVVTFRQHQRKDSFFGLSKEGPFFFGCHMGRTWPPSFWQSVKERRLRPPCMVLGKYNVFLLVLVPFPFAFWASLVDTMRFALRACCLKSPSLPFVIIWKGGLVSHYNMSWCSGLIGRGCTHMHCLTQAPRKCGNYKFCETLDLS